MCMIIKKEVLITPFNLSRMRISMCLMVLFAVKSVIR